MTGQDTAPVADAKPVDDALYFVACGLRILPAGQCCGRLLLPRHHATTCEATVHTWWSTWPAAAVALDTSRHSKAIAIEVFGTLGERSLLELQAQHGELPDSPFVLTGQSSRILILPRAARFAVRKPLGPGLSLWYLGERISKVLRRRRPGIRLLEHVVCPPRSQKAVAS
ncbi:MAG TPA: bifunctional DNA primase/polymerase [Polyangiales bacterium]|nr:bifunctional DNA primase/polymerase [Polyangiales bacterium]